MICIPVGIGNVKLAYWGYRASRILFLAMIAIGVASTVCIGASFGLLNAFTVPQYIVIVMIPIIAMVVVPYFMLRFYNNENTKQVFSATRNTHFENQSDQKLVVILLNLVWIMVFSVLILLKGAFPFLSHFLFDVKGTYILSAAIFILLVLEYLYYNGFRVAKIGMLIFYSFLILSLVVTFLMLPVKDFIVLLDLATYELQEMAPVLNMVSEINMGVFFGILIAIQTVFLLSDNRLKKSLDD